MAVAWTILLSLSVPLGWTAAADAQSFCGWQSTYPGTTGPAGYSITPGVEALPREVIVRTTAGTVPSVSAAVDHSIAQVNAATGAGWRRGPDVAPPAEFSLGDARLRPPPGELWVVGNADTFPRLPPGTYTSSSEQRLAGQPAMPVSSVIVLSRALTAPTFPNDRRLNAVVHEVGHAAGLDHHFAPWGGVCQMMSYGGGTTFGTGDVAGLRWLASRAPVRPPWGDPFGNLDVVRRSGGTVEVAGWAAQPSGATPIAIHLWVDGRFHSAIATGAPRFDVARSVPGATRNQGFATSLAVQPGAAAQVCAYAITNRTGSPHPLLGCATASA